jgi:hypothetical protein
MQVIVEDPERRDHARKVRPTLIGGRGRQGCRRNGEPCAFAIQISPEPDRDERKAIFSPSGEYPGIDPSALSRWRWHRNVVKKRVHAHSAKRLACNRRHSWFPW